MRRLRFAEPEDASALVAAVFRDWYAAAGRPASRLLVSSFLLIDPVEAIRTGAVPYWAMFGTMPSRDRLAACLARTPPYDDIRLTVFPHGADSVGLADLADWLSTSGAQRPVLPVAVNPDRYPRHFRALTGFHRELARLPDAPPVPPLRWEAASEYLTAHAAECGGSFGPEK